MDELEQQNMEGEDIKLIEDVEHAHPETKLIEDLERAHPGEEKLPEPNENE